jgi:hypothetical protein
MHDATERPLCCALLYIITTMIVQPAAMHKQRKPIPFNHNNSKMIEIVTDIRWKGDQQGGIVPLIDEIIVPPSGI